LFQIFDTARLYVRQFTIDDAENFFQLNSDPDVMQYIRPVKDREECRHFLQENIDAYAKNPMTGRWSVHQKEDDRFVGTLAVIPLDNTDYWQIGYALLKDYWGKGYATELTESGIRYSFHKMLLSKVTAVTEVTNHASMRVLKKAGFNQLDNFMQDGKELCFFELSNRGVVETDRLLIAALDNRMLHMYIDNNNRLENELGLRTGDRVLSQDLREMIDQITVPAMREATARDYYFYTLWMIIDKAENRLVAELGFKGLPNERGEIEVGYGTFPKCRGRGYMPEALAGMLGWAKNMAGIKSMTAETEQDNAASIRVMQKANFKLINKHDTRLVWSHEV